MYHIDLEFLLQSRLSIAQSFSTGIYFLFQENTIVYIGQSTVATQVRIAHHFSKGEIPFDSFVTMEVPLNQINLYEAGNIYHYEPPYNSGVPINPVFTTRKRICKSLGITTRQFKRIAEQKSLHPRTNGQIYCLYDFESHPIVTTSQLFLLNPNGANCE